MVEFFEPEGFLRSFASCVRLWSFFRFESLATAPLFFFFSGCVVGSNAVAGFRGVLVGLLFFELFGVVRFRFSLILFATVVSMFRWHVSAI